MTNKLILIAILFLGLITICFGALQYTAPLADADSIVLAVRNSAPNDQFKVAVQMLKAGHGPLIAGPVVIGSAIGLCSVVMLFRLRDIPSAL